MQNDERIVHFTTDELARLREAGTDRTDWARVDALTEEELEASIDQDVEGEIDWNRLEVEVPGPKQQLTIRFDADVIEWFKAQGPGYQTRMNAVLRSYVEAQKRR
jgi:uncharacterized protein (DUF4415 family)